MKHLHLQGIHQIHNLRIWGLTTDKTALTAHLAVEEGLNTQQVVGLLLFVLYFQSNKKKLNSTEQYLATKN